MIISITLSSMPNLKPRLVTREGNLRSPFTVRFSEYGRARERSFATLRDAKVFLLAVQRGEVAPRSDSTTVGAYFDRWIELHQVGPGSKRTYRSAFEQWIRPDLGNRPLGKLTRAEVRDLLLATLPARGLGYESVKTARKVLTSMLSEAAREGLIPANPAASIDLRREATEQADFYEASREQLDQLAAGLKSYGATVWLMRLCGCRPGEALGVSEGDFRGGTLRLSRQRMQDGSTGPLKGRKAGDFRDVPVPASIAPVSFRAIRGDDYRRRFTLAAKAAGLPPGYHPHMLRHHYASGLLAAGVPLLTVSRILGHRDAAFTARVYGHSLEASADDVRAVLDAEFS